MPAITVPFAGASVLAQRISRANQQFNEALEQVQAEARRSADNWAQHRNMVPASNIALRAGEAATAQARLEELLSVARYTLAGTDIELILSTTPDDLEVIIAVK